MRKFINDPQAANKVEFWAATTLYIFALFFLLTEAIRIDGYSSTSSIDDRVTYYLARLVRHSAFYLTYLVLHFLIAPRMARRQDTSLSIALSVTIYVFLGITLGVTDTYLKAHILARYNTLEAAYTFIFLNSFLVAFWLMALYALYSVIKYYALHLMYRDETTQSRNRMVLRDGVVALFIWMLTLFLLLIVGVEEEFILGWCVVIISAILFYCYSFVKLIPYSLARQKPIRTYGIISLIVAVVSIFPVGLIIVALINNGDAALGYASFNAMFQLLITAPVNWLLFKRHLKGNEEVYALKKELGQSHASFDFLRSQINPHFLFNALNTIYGTAIQEKAERTSEGIEKLGDMMRFMLQENMQDKIALSREIDYLNNYISLQKLRTDISPDIRIQTAIENHYSALQISPMLLIPFVENAFKHGISFREPSHIKITLEVRDKKLFFDVYNSKHEKSENDPEKDKSGIGLQNVRQRLQLLYPSTHELIIRETGKEFFVHLTIQLS